MWYFEKFDVCSILGFTFRFAYYVILLMVRFMYSLCPEKDILVYSYIQI
jgi:hypothetical protein